MYFIPEVMYFVPKFYDSSHFSEIKPIFLFANNSTGNIAAEMKNNCIAWN